MELSKQVCGRELAERMKFLGFPQKSYLYHSDCCEQGELECKYWHDAYQGEWGDCHKMDLAKSVSAFSVAELADMLPGTIEDDEDGSIFSLYIFKKNKKWYVAYKFENNTSNVYVEEDNKLADAMAKMLVYLAENVIFAVWLVEGKVCLITPKNIKK